MAQSFYENLKKSDALIVTAMPTDSAREMVRRGKLVAFVGVKTDSNGGSNLFATGLPEVDIGIDPSRKASAGYLQGLVTQALYTMLQEQITDPEQLRSSVIEGIQNLDSTSGLPEGEREIIKSFLSAVLEFNDEMASSDSAAQSTFGSVSINIEEITRQIDQPQSAWEITFPQSLLWAIIGIAAAFAVSIVSERVRGTFIRLQLAPVKRMHILAGKASACFVASVTMSLILMSIGGTQRQRRGFLYHG